MTSTPTLKQLREEARRVFGDDVIGVDDTYFAYPNKMVVELSGRRQLSFGGRSRAAARRLAYETLQALPTKGAV